MASDKLINVGYTTEGVPQEIFLLSKQLSKGYSGCKKSSEGTLPEYSLTGSLAKKFPLKLAIATRSDPYNRHNLGELECDNYKHASE